MTNHEPIRVAVAGAAGRIGYSLVFRIAAGGLFGPEQPVSLSAARAAGRARRGSKPAPWSSRIAPYPLLTELMIGIDSSRGVRGGGLDHSAGREAVASPRLAQPPRLAPGQCTNHGRTRPCHQPGGADGSHPRGGAAVQHQLLDRPVAGTETFQRSTGSPSPSSSAADDEHDRRKDRRSLSHRSLE